MPLPRFRIAVWDPYLILAQIIALQTLQYAAVSLAIVLVDVLLGTDPTLGHLFDYREFRGDTGLGWTLAMGWTVGSAAGILTLIHLVQRAKLCLDFTLTFHFIHLVITTFYSRGLPNNFLWWFVQVVTCASMVVGGERACMKRELEPIELSGGGNRTTGLRSSILAGRKKRGSSEYEMLPVINELEGT